MMMYTLQFSFDVLAAPCTLINLSDCSIHLCDNPKSRASQDCHTCVTLYRTANVRQSVKDFAQSWNSGINSFIEAKERSSFDNCKSKEHGMRNKPAEHPSKTLFTSFRNNISVRCCPTPNIPSQFRHSFGRPA